MRLHARMTYNRAINLSLKGGDNTFPKGKVEVALVENVGEQDCLFTAAILGDGEGWRIQGHDRVLTESHEVELHGGHVIVSRPLTMYEALGLLCKALQQSAEGAINSYAAYQDDCFRAATGN